MERMRNHILVDVLQKMEKYTLAETLLLLIDHQFVSLKRVQETLNEGAAAIAKRRSPKSYGIKKIKEATDAEQHELLFSDEHGDEQLES